MTILKEIRSKPPSQSQGASPVAASEVSTPRAHARVSHRKSRTGCRVCKIRRVKCDEGKPACNRCTSTGRKCEGYPNLSPSLRPSKSPPAQVPTPPSDSPYSLSLYRLSLDIPGDDTERRSFAYLRERAIHDISGYFESEFWDRLVLQISHTEPTVRHALLALSSLCETYDSDGPGHDHAENQDHHQGNMQFALRQYNKAVRLLADDLSKSQSRLDVTLTSCLVFIWLEFMRNDFDAGLNHLKSGLKILQDFCRPVKSPGSPAQHIDASLLRLFARLEIQATVHGSPTSDFNSEVSSGNPEPLATTPPLFSSIEQARNCLTSLMDPVFRFIRQIHDPDFIRAQMQSHPWPDPLSLEATCRLHLKQFRQWHAAIRNSPSSAFRALDTRQSAAISLLHLHHRTVTILLQTLFTQSQMIYDLYDTSFEQVLSLAEHLIQNFQNTGSIIFFDMGVMAPLFYVVLKCRTLTLRRKALSLLRLSPRREGMWHRRDVVQYAEWKIEIEERGRGGRPEMEALPEEARIWNEQMKDVVVRGSQKTRVRFQRRRNGRVEYDEEVTNLNTGMGQLL